ncbi:MAG TPA: YgiT-type zinc finger protein [Candidatus Limnocylindrales bacterium]|nr:YgiT-type zinc finger protein [Candidatus Limnocylindrales bacterium]
MKRKKARDLTGEICTRCCVGRLAAKRGREYFRHGDEMMIIEDVPAWVCNKCGERYHHARVFKRMREIAAGSGRITKHVRVPVARYKAGDQAA